MNNENQSDNKKEFRWPAPGSIESSRKNLDRRELDYTKKIASPMTSVRLAGDPQLGVPDSVVSILPSLPSIQCGAEGAFGTTGTFFQKGAPPSAAMGGETAVNIDNFLCSCGRADRFVVTQQLPYKAKKIGCTACGSEYGIIPENAYSVITSPAAGVMSPEELNNVVNRLPKTKMYIVLDKK